MTKKISYLNDKETIVSNSALFDKVLKNDSIKIGVAINANMLEKIEIHEFIVLHTLANMVDTASLTLEELKTNVASKMKKSGLVKGKASSLTFYKWADILTDDKVKRLVSLAQLLFGGFDIFMNKAGNLAVKRDLKNATLSLLSASLYRMEELTDAKTGEKSKVKIRTEFTADIKAQVSAVMKEKPDAIKFARLFLSEETIAQAEKAEKQAEKIAK